MNGSKSCPKPVGLWTQGKPRPHTMWATWVLTQSFLFTASKLRNRLGTVVMLNSPQIHATMIVDWTSGCWVRFKKMDT